ncbi:MAG: hypothetical protein N3A55_07350 [Methylohalobius sp.]|nr:hypothetical protein [Methylohalobius sp.]
MYRVIWINFYLAVLLSVIGGAIVLVKPDLIFPEIMQIYGPLARNLLIIVLYLLVFQLLLWAFCYRRSGYLEALIMGGALLIAALGIPFYSHVNGLPISLPLVLGMAYCGLSHLLYFAYAYLHFRDER